MWPPGSVDTVCPRPPLTLTFDRLTLKLVCESHIRWRTFIPNYGMLCRWVLGLFAMYATDGEMDGQKQRLSPPSYGQGHNKLVLSQLKRLWICGWNRKMFGIHCQSTTAYWSKYQIGVDGQAPGGGRAHASCPIASGDANSVRWQQEHLPVYWSFRWR